jgi:hypothetical protein
MQGYNTLCWNRKISIRNIQEKTTKNIQSRLRRFLLRIEKYLINLQKGIIEKSELGRQLSPIANVYSQGLDFFPS